MDKDYFDDIFYTASLVEYISRCTHNEYSDIVNAVGRDAFYQLIDLADVNHCLSFLQVSDEIIKRYGIAQGQYNTPELHGKPTYLQIGKRIATIIARVEPDPEQYGKQLFTFFTTPSEITYKGYRGSIRYSYIDAVFYGQVTGIHSLISYEGANTTELLNDFCDAVDDYLVMCTAEGIEPEKPLHEYKGRKSQERLTLLMPYICRDLAAKISKEQNVTGEEAVSMLYNSLLYEYLKDEATKVWRYSTAALYDMFVQEQEEGKIDFPEP